MAKIYGSLLRLASRTALTLVALASTVSSANAAERRCGWFVNPTPWNYWLVDREGIWILSAQGGYAAEGMDDLPDMARFGWVVTNGPGYGHGCACLQVVVDRTQKRVVSLLAAEPVPLARCQADPALPPP